MSPEEEVALLKLKVAHLEDALKLVEINHASLLIVLQDKSRALAKADDELSRTRQNVLRLNSDLDMMEQKLLNTKKELDKTEDDLFAATKTILQERNALTKEKLRSDGLKHHFLHEAKKETMAKLDGYLMALSEIGNGKD